MTGPAGRLSIELVPATAWWSNVRSNVSRTDWEKCKRYAKAKTDGVCIICGSAGQQQGYRHAVDAHEIWEYDDERRIQTLVDIVPLCPRCHACKHLGRTRAVSDRYQWERIIGHFQWVNDWPDERVERYIDLIFKIHKARSRLSWRLDISWLERELGIVAPPLDRSNVR